MILMILLAHTGEIITATDLVNDPVKLKGFQDEYGADQAHRLAVYDGDDGNSLVLVVSAQDGPKKDGAAEFTQLAMLDNRSESKTMLATMQGAAPKFSGMTAEKADLIGKFFAEAYLTADKQDSVLSAKGDPELDRSKLDTLYFAQDGEKYTAKSQDDKVDDYVIDGETAFVYIGDTLTVLATSTFDENMANEYADPAFAGAVNTVNIGQDMKLARAVDIQAEPGNIIRAIAYVKNGGERKQMVLLDGESLGEIKSIDFDGNYATAGHDPETMVLVGHEIDETLEGGEKFTVTRQSRDEFLAAA